MNTPRNVNAMVRHVVVFEKIGLLSAMVMFKNLFQGNDVRYFQCSPWIERLPVLTKYFTDSRIKRVIPGEIELDSQIKLNNEVLDRIDEVYESHFAGRKFVCYTRDALDSDGIHAAFKKELSLRMLEKFQVFQRLESLSGQYTAPVFYYPEDTFYQEPFVSPRLQELAGREKIVIPFSAKLLACVTESLDKISWLLIFAAFLPWILIQSLFFEQSGPEKTGYQLGIRIYANDYAFIPKYRSIDFLVSKDCPSRENTLFCVETEVSQHYLDTLREKGCHYIEVRKMLKTSGFLKTAKQVIPEMVPLWFRSAGSLVSQKPYIIRLFIEIQYKKLVWAAVLSRYSFKHYVTYNDTISGDTIRNILMRKTGTDTWYFIHSIDNYDHYTPGRENALYREVLYSFLYFDHIVVWGNNSEQFYRSCPNFFRHYDKLGCLWSEHISSVLAHPETNEVSASMREHFLKRNGRMPEKIIGVFDTTAGGAQMPLQAADMRAFIDGILHLLEKFPEAGIVFKIKNPLEYTEQHYPGILEMYQDLFRHPRCYRTTGTQIDPAEVTAVSDLVISACFTSITVEALGAQKRAFYYDATGKFRNLYYDRFPRFVAHDAEELITLVRYWLYECPEEEFRRFLKEHIQGELESCIDGRAITRFRQLLCR